MSGGKAARDYGIRFEQDLAKHLGHPTTRSTRPGVHDDAADIAIPGICLEAKARHCGTGGTPPRWSLWSWFNDTEAKCTYDQLPAVALKRPGHPIGDTLLVVRLSDIHAIAERLA
jgi:hypothetical protein